MIELDGPYSLESTLRICKCLCADFPQRILADFGKRACGCRAEPGLRVRHVFQHFRWTNLITGLPAETDLSWGAAVFRSGFPLRCT